MGDVVDVSSDHWAIHARQWMHVGPPLRPSRFDVTYFSRRVQDWQRRNPTNEPIALVLGATPEFARLDWPMGTMLLAIDRSMGMLRSVWPGFPKAEKGGVCADWLRLPLPSHAVDVVVADGVWTTLDFPSGYGLLAAALREVLHQRRGELVLRCFVAPEIPELADKVVDDLLRGRIGSFHAFKWRLAMAMQQGAASGIRLGEVWDFWERQRINQGELVGLLGWDPEAIATIDAYRDVNTRYTFPTLSELIRLLRGYFEEVTCEIPPYELGSRCPIIVLRQYDPVGADNNDYGSIFSGVRAL